jgi:hypothetical protein
MSRQSQEIVRRRLISNFYDEEFSALSNDIKSKTSPLPDKINYDEINPLPDEILPDEMKSKMAPRRDEVNDKKLASDVRDGRWSTAFKMGESLGENLGLTLFAILGFVGLAWLWHHFFG